MNKFGFRVSAPSEDSIYGWEVSLPHHCDEWMIHSGYAHQSRDEAVNALEKFIEEAQEALAALREGREFGNE